MLSVSTCGKFVPVLRLKCVREVSHLTSKMSAVSTWIPSDIDSVGRSSLTSTQPLTIRGHATVRFGRKRSTPFLSVGSHCGLWVWSLAVNFFLWVGSTQRYTCMAIPKTCSAVEVFQIYSGTLLDQVALAWKLFQKKIITGKMLKKVQD